MTRLLLLAAAATMSSCNLLPLGCTEIGCGLDGLRVDVAGLASTQFTAAGTADGKTFDVACPKGFQQFEGFAIECLDTHVTIVGTAQVVSLTVTDASGKTATAEHRPTYVETFPNGEDCAPACHSATAQMTVAAP